MSQDFLIGLASLAILGIAAQWISWFFKLPSIILLLLFGFLAGPVSGLINPNQLFGDLLFPFVSLSVAVILFEGGLSLKLSDLKEIKNVVRNLVTIGVFITGGISAVAAYYILNLDLKTSVLLGSILVVTGPTVIIPLLFHIKPSRKVGSITKWEGITVDPIGATIAVLVFEVILTGGFDRGFSHITLGIIKTIVYGSSIGFATAAILTILLKKFMIPDFLHAVVSLMFVIIAFTCSNILQTESGLLAVTVMGIVLANQKFVTIKHIVTFKENLTVLLISGLFILLAAQVNLSDFRQININDFVFLGVLLFIARPLSVIVSSIKSDLNWQETIFLSWLAPRGIVAAAVSSVFVLHLSEAGHDEFHRIIPIVFFVIICTVTIYGTTSPLVARWLKLAKPNPQGILFVGAHEWLRKIAIAIKDEEYDVVVVDTNWNNLTAARMEGLRTYHASILSEYFIDEIDLFGIGKLLALTSNDEVNALATLHFKEIFGRSEVYQLSCNVHDRARTEAISHHQRGRLLFDPKVDFLYLDNKFKNGAVVKKTLLTEEFDHDEYQKMYDGKADLLFLITESKDLKVITNNYSPKPKPGQTLISVIED